MAFGGRAVRFSVMRPLRTHWFYTALPLLIVSTIGFRETHPWREQPLVGEAVLLFDWCVLVLALFLICYRDLPGRALALRCLALVCGGIWFVGLMVPDAAEAMLASLGWARLIGIALLGIVEGVAMVAVVRALFGKTPEVAALERSGIPPVVIRFMLAEVRFWRWLWARLTGRQRCGA